MLFLLGGRPGSAELAAMALKDDYPTLTCTTYCPPLGFEQSADELNRADAVTSAQPGMLFAAFGAPKPENSIYEHGLQLSVPVCIGVGGSFEIVGGVVPRAPMWTQNIGCEWLYRLCREPRRMWRRYLFGNLEFAAIVLRQRLRRAFLNTFMHYVNEDRFAAELSELTLLAQESLDGVSSSTVRDVKSLTTPNI